MCAISALTRCGTFPSHPFTSLPSPQVKKKALARSCFHRSVEVGLFGTLGFALRCAVARHFNLSVLQGTKEEVHNTHDALIVEGFLKIGVGLLKRLGLLFRHCSSAYT